MNQTTERRRVLHLAYEDPLAPGSGGGSVRTRELNDRLADRFDIDQVFVPFPGSAPSCDGALHTEHLGSKRGGRFVRQLAYFAKLPAYVRRHGSDYDLIVEDFGAPFGSVGVPRLSRTPTLGVVQWLFAKEKSQQYHLPFTPVESFGLRSHHLLIAVSSGLAAEIRRRHPRADVSVVANGLPGDVLAGRVRPEQPRRDMVFMGRLDVAHKGLDLLLDAYRAIAADVPQDLVVYGDGDGRDWLERRVGELGLDGRVRLPGRIAGEHRFAALAAADVVAMPSRYESFGMVAAEAAAVATPLVSFDIPCLRDLVAPSLRVASFDVPAYAEVLRGLCLDATRRRTLGDALPATVAHLSWDLLAQEQAQVYERAMAASPTGITRRARSSVAR